MCLFLFLLGALDNLMCFWWYENNRCIISGWIFGFACVRAGEICYARLSELFLAQTGSFRLSENGSNPPPFSFECSPERRPLAWARWASLSENSKYSLFSISLKRKFFAWVRDYDANVLYLCFLKILLFGILCFYMLKPLKSRQFSLSEGF